MTRLRTEGPVSEGRYRSGTAKHRRIVFSTTGSVCASFGQHHAKIAVQVSRSEKVRNEGDLAITPALTTDQGAIKDDMWRAVKA